VPVHPRGERTTPGKRSTALLTSLVGTKPGGELLYVILAAHAEYADHGHSLRRHGADVSDDQLKRRVTDGIAPDEAFSPTPVSTRFKTHEKWWKARSAALERLKREDRAGLATYQSNRAAYPANRLSYNGDRANYLALEGMIRDQEQRVENRRNEANVNYLRDYLEANYYDRVPALIFDNTESVLEVADAQFQIEHANFVNAHMLFMQIRAGWDQKINRMLNGELNSTPRIAPATVPRKPNPPVNPQGFTVRRVLRHTGKYARGGLGVGFEEDPAARQRPVPDPSQPTNRAADQPMREATRPIAGNLVNTVMTIETTDGIDWSVVQFFPTPDAHDIEL